jgi:hypothetical protein
MASPNAKTRMKTTHRSSGQAELPGQPSTLANVVASAYRVDEVLVAH